MQPPVFKNSPRGRQQRNDDRWRSANPFILACRSMLLVDDIIHRRVHKAADWTIVRASKVTKGKVQLTKRKLIVPTLAIGTVASTTAVALFDGHGISGGLCWLAGLVAIKVFGVGWALKKVYDIITEDLGDVKTLMQHDAEKFLKKLRLFGLAFVAFAPATINYDKFYEVYTTLTVCVELASISIAAYLASSSNGMRERAKDWVKGLWQKIREKTRARVSVPVTVGNRNESLEA
ncbi:hypothetical protein HY992_04315 [Candidatus Micrarchaeota archaeon]|nr:hypothetical protein [Candidatus Micrarchaeota archaeon]